MDVVPLVFLYYLEWIIITPDIIEYINIRYLLSFWITKYQNIEISITTADIKINIIGIQLGIVFWILQYIYNYLPRLKNKVKLNYMRKVLIWKIEPKSE